MQAISEYSGRVQILRESLAEGATCHLVDSQTTEVEEDWLAAPRYAALCEIALARFGSDAAIVLARRYDPRCAGVTGYLAFAQPTLREALRCFCRHSGYLMQGAWFELTEEGSTARFSYRHERQRISFDEVFTIAIFAEILNRYQEGGTAIIMVHLAEDTASKTALASHCGAPVHETAADSSLAFRADLLDLPNPMADPLLRAPLERLMRNPGPASPSKTDPLVVDLQDMIARSIEMSLPQNVDDLANRLGLSRRTLQRYLAERGHTLTALRDEIHMDFACRWLEQPTKTVAEIRTALGYKSTTSFVRAFRRWTGTTPASYRRSVSRSVPSRGTASDL